jgi:hypothetical protein
MVNGSFASASVTRLQAPVETYTILTTTQQAPEYDGIGCHVMDLGTLVNVAEKDVIGPDFPIFQFRPDFATKTPVAGVAQWQSRSFPSF